MHKFIFISPIIIILASCFPSTLLPSSTVPTNDISSYTPTQTSQVAATLQTSSAPIATLESADQIFYSSDKNFVAKRYSLYSRPSLDGPVIEIYNSQNELLWQIPYQGEISTGDPSSSLSIYRWSKDNKYLYFYYVFYPDGGDYAFWWDGFNLQRIDVQTGKTEQVIPSDPKSFEAFSFSPDETQIAYTRQQDNPYIFYIRDLLTGVERTSYILFPSKNYSRV